MWYKYIRLYDYAVGKWWMLLTITVLLSPGVLQLPPTCSILPESFYTSSQIVLLYCLNLLFAPPPSHPEPLEQHYEVLFLPCQDTIGLTSLFPLPHPIAKQVLCVLAPFCFHLPEHSLFPIFLPLPMLLLCLKRPSLPCPTCPSLPFRFCALCPVISWKHQVEWIAPSSGTPLDLKGILS